MTPRALLSLIRISQAIAKLRMRPVVDAFDIDMARQLLNAAEESGISQNLIANVKKQDKSIKNIQQIVKNIINDFGNNGGEET